MSTIISAYDRGYDDGYQAGFNEAYEEARLPHGTHNVSFPREICACGSAHGYCQDCGGEQVGPCENPAVYCSTTCTDSQVDSHPDGCNCDGRPHNGSDSTNRLHTSSRQSDAPGAAVSPAGVTTGDEVQEPGATFTNSDSQTEKCPLCHDDPNKDCWGCITDNDSDSRKHD